VDITHFVHDNQVYGLTKGQASPTSVVGMVTGVQTDGNFNEPLNPMLVAIAAGAGFVARGFTGNREQLISLMKEAVTYNGYALVDILQPCVSFNKVNTLSWYKNRCMNWTKCMIGRTKWPPYRKRWNLATGSRSAFCITNKSRPITKKTLF
jgi:2-oxoglutarate ferredoxin oxidoreductase subunit beta